MSKSCKCFYCNKSIYDQHYVLAPGAFPELYRKRFCFKCSKVVGIDYIVSLVPFNMNNIWPRACKFCGRATGITNDEEINEKYGNYSTNRFYLINDLGTINFDICFFCAEKYFGQQWVNWLLTKNAEKG